MNIEKRNKRGYNQVIKGGGNMVYILSGIIGYLFGSINMAIILSKSRGVDIKKVGSNNAGASNVFISVGKIYGIAVGAFDIFKAFAAAMLVSLLFESSVSASVFAGIMAVVGHTYPFWLGKKAGKGFAPLMGTVLFYDWKLFLILVVAVVAIVLITDYIVIGTFGVALFMPFYAFFIKDDVISALMFGLLTILIYFNHRDNIKRLRSGTEIGMRKGHK